MILTDESDSDPFDKTMPGEWSPPLAASAITGFRKKHLKSELTFEILDTFSMEMSCNEAAKSLQKERRKLFKTIFEKDKKYA